jgi:hypothetical protein
MVVSTANPGYRAVLINHIKTELLPSSTTTGLAFVFYDHQEKPTASHIIACLVKQLAA